MARFISDQNQVLFKYESGTYATASGTGHWIGMVQDHTLDDNTNVNSVRYVGGGTRNVDQFVDGPLDHTGTFNFFPQDWKFLMFAMGSIADSGSPSPYTHGIGEVNSTDGNKFTSGTKNPFISYTIEAAQQSNPTGLNFIRTMAGCMSDTTTVTMSQGVPISVEVGYVAQSVTFSSGTVTAVTAATTRPFLWSDVAVHLPSGTKIDTTNEVTFSISNNIEPPHYLNGSRQVGVPIPLNRDYEVGLTLHADSTWAKPFYDQYFLGGSTFNMMVEVTDASAGAGSRNAFMIMSGCKCTDMASPEQLDGANENTITIVPKTVVVNVNDTIELYGAF